MSEIERENPADVEPVEQDGSNESDLIGLNDLPAGATQSIVDTVNSMSRSRKLALVASMPEHNHSVLQRRYSTVGGLAEADGLDLFDVLVDQVREVQKGNLSEVEATLMAQVKTLDTIFVRLATRAEMNMGEHMKAMETYLRLAMKAQSQCRATAETLAEIKNPRSVAFVRQANIANNQQVNSGQPTPVAEPRAEQHQSEQNELLEVIPSERLDTGTQSKAGRADSPMEAVGAVYRPDNNRGQRGGIKKRF